MNKISAAIFLPFLFSAAGLCEALQFETSDGIELVGEYYAPASVKGAIVLHHGLGSVGGEWSKFAEYISSQGYGVFFYDARGHGKSTAKKSGGSVDYHYFFGRGPKSDWGKMIADMDSAVRFLSEAKQVDSKKIAVGGASIGANIAFRYAATHPDVPYAVLLSPGMDYQGITVSDLFPAYIKSRRKILIAASKPDRYSHQSAMALKDVASYLGAGPMAAFWTEKQGHGVQMFARKNQDQPSELEIKILKWIEDRQKK